MITAPTVKSRALTFSLGQLLDASRRGTRVCLICADLDTPASETTCRECMYGTGAMLRDPNDVIIMNYGPRRSPR